MNKIFTIGDIHGAYKALLQVIKSSSIDKENDTLIVLGDVVDGWQYVKECVEELLTFKNLITIRGNHDQWFMDWRQSGKAEPLWMRQGGSATVHSYDDNDELMNNHMINYFNKSVTHYLDDKNRLFVHEGLDWHKPLDENDDNDFIWDRHAYQTAIQWDMFSLLHPDKPKMWFKDYKEVFVGHSTTQWPVGWNYTPGTEPVFATNLINLDTGAGWSGKLTIMNIDSKEYFQSDLVEELYPEETIKRR